VWLAASCIPAKTNPYDVFTRGAVNWRAFAQPGSAMDDLVFVLLTAAFFAASFWLVHLFERLRERK
jgi:hypothetical protein